MEFEGARQNPNLSLATSIWPLTPKYRMLSWTDFSIVIYVWNSIKNTEFDGIGRGPLKSESVAGDLHLASDAKVWYAGLKELQHDNLRLKLYQDNELDGIRRGLP